MLRTTDVIRKMADQDLRLVWYHAKGIGKKKSGPVELQTASARAMNSVGFTGPTTVAREVLSELLELKLVEKTAASDDAKSIFHLSETGRTHVERQG